MMFLMVYVLFFYVFYCNELSYCLEMVCYWEEDNIIRECRFKLLFLLPRLWYNDKYFYWEKTKIEKYWKPTLAGIARCLKDGFSCNSQTYKDIFRRWMRQESEAHSPPWCIVSFGFTVMASLHSVKPFTISNTWHSHTWLTVVDTIPSFTLLSK